MENYTASTERNTQKRTWITSFSIRKWPDFLYDTVWVVYWFLQQHKSFGNCCKEGWMRNKIESNLITGEEKWKLFRVYSLSCNLSDQVPGCFQWLLKTNWKTYRFLEYKWLDSEKGWGFTENTINLYTYVLGQESKIVGLNSRWYFRKWEAIATHCWFTVTCL